MRWNQVIRACALVVLFNAGRTAIYGQQVLASSGAEFQSGNLAIAFTIGEPVIATQTGGSAVVTQGFHQPPTDFTTAVVAAPDPSIQVSAFPNPAREQVTLVAQGVEGVLEFRLHDALGRLVETHAQVPATHLLEVGHLSSGLYNLVVLHNHRPIATIKLSIAR
jgi:hypothetical protein